MQKELWQERAGKEVMLSGDGRNDSSGHSAQYCTYTLADMETKTILQLEIVDVREVEGRKSANMERIGFERVMNTLIATEMNIKEVVTDGHAEIGTFFSKYHVVNLKCVCMFVVDWGTDVANTGIKKCTSKASPSYFLQQKVEMNTSVIYLGEHLNQVHQVDKLLSVFLRELG